MADPRLIAETLVRHFRNPSDQWKRLSYPDGLLANLDLVIKFALAKPVNYSSGANVPLCDPRELATAARFFMRQVLFREDANHYDVLGLSPNASTAAIRQHHRLLIQIAHPDRLGTGANWPANVAARVNRAYSVLKNPEARMAYDLAELDLVRRDRTPTPADQSTVRTTSPSLVAPTRPQPAAVLREWLSTALGGRIVQHPGFYIFATTFFICAMIVAAVMWSESEDFLVRSDRAPASLRPVGMVSTMVSPAPGGAEAAALLASFVAAYEAGSVDAVIGHFDTSPRSGIFQDLARIRNEYDALFAATMWRRMRLTGLVWRSVGDRTNAAGEVTINIGWNDGHEVEQRFGLNVEFVRSGGRAVIARLIQEVR